MRFHPMTVDVAKRVPTFAVALGLIGASVSAPAQERASPSAAGAEAAEAIKNHAIGITTAIRDGYVDGTLYTLGSGTPVILAPGMPGTTLSHRIHVSIPPSGTLGEEKPAARNSRGEIVEPAVTSGPPNGGSAGLGAEELACVMGTGPKSSTNGLCNPALPLPVPAGGAGAIGIVIELDHNPDAVQNLATYSAQFGITSNTNFHYIYATADGSQPPVSANGTVARLESDADAQMMRAIAPNLDDFYMIEADPTANGPDGASDVFTALKTAGQIAQQSGKPATISMSLTMGASSAAFENIVSARYLTNAPGTFWIASSGDSSGGYGLPAGIANQYATVIGVGATTVQFYVDGTYGQTVWNVNANAVTASGYNLNDAQPSWQKNISALGLPYRAGPDIAVPGNNIWVFSTGTWQLGAGTSFASPLFAASVNDYFGVGGGALTERSRSEAMPQLGFPRREQRIGSVYPTTAEFAATLYGNMMRGVGFTPVTGDCGTWSGDGTTIALISGTPPWDWCAGGGQSSGFSGFTSTRERPIHVR
jgi:hypothetical protein